MNFESHARVPCSDLGSEAMQYEVRRTTWTTFSHVVRFRMHFEPWTGTRCLSLLSGIPFLLARRTRVRHCSVWPPLDVWQLLVRCNTNRKPDV